MLKGLVDKVSGWKLHGIAFGWIALTLVEKIGGLDIPDFDPGENWVNGIFAALGVSAFRSTVKAITGK